MQRLVLDCRLVNAYFKDSPFTEIAAAEALASVETEVDQEVFIASGDIKACFYQCGIDEALSEWFCLPTVSGDEARAIGINAYDDGTPLPAGAAAVSLSMAVLPMGFSWAFWFVQRLHLEILKRSDVPTERIALSHWPFPSLQDGPVEVPYCDNVTVLGVDKVAVTRVRDSVIVAFRAAGFEMHEISETEPQAIVLGTEAGGKRPSSRRDGSKGLMVKVALQWLAKGPTCTGRQVEVIVGHYIAACISNRSGLSVPRAIYNFIRDCYCKPTRLWPSVRYECIIMSNIVMHLRANWSRPWSDIVTCSDASPNGSGSGSASNQARRLRLSAGGTKNGASNDSNPMSGVPGAVPSDSALKSRCRILSYQFALRLDPLTQWSGMFEKDFQRCQGA
jgi:hypothetical protein